MEVHHILSQLCTVCIGYYLKIQAKGEVFAVGNGHHTRGIFVTEQRRHGRDAVKLYSGPAVHIPLSFIQSLVEVLYKLWVESVLLVPADQAYNYALVHLLDNATRHCTNVGVGLVAAHALENSSDYGPGEKGYSLVHSHEEGLQSEQTDGRHNAATVTGVKRSRVVRSMQCI